TSFRRRLLNVGSLEAARRVCCHGWHVGAVAARASRHPRRRHHLHARVPLRETYPPEQQARARLFAGQGALDVQPPRMDGGVAQALTAALWGLAVAGMLFERGEVAQWLAVCRASTWAEVGCISSPLSSPCHAQRRPSWRRTPLIIGHH